MTWTKEDEALLVELQHRKADHERALWHEVERAVDKWHCYNMTSGDIAVDLIAHAAEIRKVLEPFDEENL